MGGRETVRTGGKGDETLRRGGEREKGREGGEVDPPQFSLNEKKGEDEGGGRGGKSRREEREGGVVVVGGGRRESERIGENGKFSRVGGKPPNIPRSSIRRARWRPCEICFKILLQFRTGGHVVLVPRFRFVYSFPLFSSLFFYSLRRVRCSRSLFLSLFVFDVSGIVGTTPVEAGVGSLRKEVLIVG